MVLVKFHVDPAVSEKMDKQLISNDLGGLSRIQWMVFKMEGESWQLIGEGPPSKDWFEQMLKHVPAKEGRHLVFRAENGNTDCWIKYIPDDENVKTRTLFSTASDSLFASCRPPKNKLELREFSELSRNNRQLAQYFA